LENTIVSDLRWLHHWAVAISWMPGLISHFSGIAKIFGAGWWVFYLLQVFITSSL